MPGDAARELPAPLSRPLEAPTSPEESRTADRCQVVVHAFAETLTGAVVSAETSPDGVPRVGSPRIHGGSEVSAERSGRTALR